MITSGAYEPVAYDYGEERLAAASDTPRNRRSARAYRLAQLARVAGLRPSLRALKDNP